MGKIRSESLLENVCMDIVLTVLNIPLQLCANTASLLGCEC